MQRLQSLVGIKWRGSERQLTESTHRPNWWIMIQGRAGLQLPLPLSPFWLPNRCGQFGNAETHGASLSLLNANRANEILDCLVSRDLYCLVLSISCACRHTKCFETGTVTGLLEFQGLHLVHLLGELVVGYGKWTEELRRV